MEKMKEGDIVKFHTPYDDEDPNQLYVILNIAYDVDKPRADIKPISNHPTFSPINTVYVEDLELAVIKKSNLIDHTVNVIKADKTYSTGKVIDIINENEILDFKKNKSEIINCIKLKIQESTGVIQMGYLVIG
jgi:hypothetical protein